MGRSVDYQGGLKYEEARYMDSRGGISVGAKIRAMRRGERRSMCLRSGADSGVSGQRFGHGCHRHGGTVLYRRRHGQAIADGSVRRWRLGEGKTGITV